PGLRVVRSWAERPEGEFGFVVWASHSAQRRDEGWEADSAWRDAAPSPPPLSPPAGGRGGGTPFQPALGGGLVGGFGAAARAGVLQIVCVSRAEWIGVRCERPARAAPDIVVFDESFANNEVPFAAFTARQGLFEAWNGPGKSTFHSTTFQPNTISTLHFVRCL